MASLGNSKYAKYFSQVKSNKDIKVCTYKSCNKSVIAKGSNRTNLASHLWLEHKIKINSDCGFSNPINKIDSYAVDFLNSETFDTMITQMICCDLTPPHRIAKKNSYQVLYKKAFGQKVTEYKAWKSIQKVHDAIEKKLKSILSKSEEVPTVTCDDWGSQNGRDFCNINAYCKENGKTT